MDLQEYNRVVGALADEFAETELHPLLHFPWAIKRMNTMYSLPINEVATLDGLNESPVTRLAGFIKTFRNEVVEGLDIQAFLIVREMLNAGTPVTDEVINEIIAKIGIKDEAHAAKLAQQIVTLLQVDREEFDRQVLVALADWFGDMVVYIRSEAMKFGIPLESVLAVIMGSNFTKLDENGEPRKDENGKVQKGPNFIPPERHIYATLFEQEELMEQAGSVFEMVNSLNAVAVPVLSNPIADIFENHDHDDEDAYDEDDAAEADDTAEADEDDPQPPKDLFPK